jgi:DNA-binding IscR family transcriptional regulator
MAERAAPMTSEDLAACMHTNPVVVRRMMAGLREVGFVQSEKGHGGGWTIACDLAAVTIKDIYDALGSPTVFALGNRSEAPECLVEQALNDALDGAFRDAEALLIERLANISLADLSNDFNRRFAARKAHTRKHPHAL